MTEDEKLSLEEEMDLCLNHLRFYAAVLDSLNREKEKVWTKYCEWKKRYEDADMKLALETKLTIVKRGRRSETADSLETVLADKEKVKKLIKLLREEVTN